MISKDLFTAVDEESFDFSNVDFESYDALKYNPVGVNIDPDTNVDLVRDAQVIRTGTWEEIVTWINDNFHSLNGKFDVSRGGAVLHTITLSS